VRLRGLSRGCCCGWQPLTVYLSMLGPRSMTLAQQMDLFRMIDKDGGGTVRFANPYA